MWGPVPYDDVNDSMPRCCTPGPCGCRWPARWCMPAAAAPGGTPPAPPLPGPPPGAAAAPAVEVDRYDTSGPCGRQQARTAQEGDVGDRGGRKCTPVRRLQQHSPNLDSRSAPHARRPARRSRWQRDLQMAHYPSRPAQGRGRRGPGSANGTQPQRQQQRRRGGGGVAPCLRPRQLLPRPRPAERTHCPARTPASSGLRRQLHQARLDRAPRPRLQAAAAPSTALLRP
jgi:hypothetical protein